MMRASEPGWEHLSAHDPSGRRGVWVRRSPLEAYTPDAQLVPLVRVDVCAGREGDDHYVSFAVGQVLDARALHALYDALDAGVWFLAEADGHGVSALCPVVTPAEAFEALAWVFGQWWRARAWGSLIEHRAADCRIANERRSTSIRRVGAPGGPWELFAYRVWGSADNNESESMTRVYPDHALACAAALRWLDDPDRFDAPEEP